MPETPARHSTASYELYRQILEVVALIPYGRVASYGQVAKLAGLPRHARLVGYVLKHLDQNSPLPWHRVVNAQGKISCKKVTESGENLQQIRLAKEGVEVIYQTIQLQHFQWQP